MTSIDPQAKNDLREEKRPARKAILVLGMHRSGTSALSHLLTELGVDAPANLMSPNEDNPKGYFESMPLYLLHDELLASAGSSWDDYRPIPEGWAASPKADEFHQRLKEEVQAEYGRSGFFLMKDPRVCRLVPLWRALLDDMQVEPLFIHTHRNPLEVASSLNKRNGFDLGYGYLVWLRHILDAEAGSRGRKRSFTSYDQILADWPTEVTKIASDLGISWPKYAASHAPTLNMIIEPGLKHNAANTGNIHGSQIIPTWIEVVQEIFERWAYKGENTKDHSRLDEIRHAFNESTNLFCAVVHSQGTRLIAERDEAKNYANEVILHKDEQQNTIDILNSEIAVLKSEIESNNHQIVIYNKDIALLNDVFVNVEECLNRSDNYKVQLSNDLIKSKSELENLQAQYTQNSEANELAVSNYQAKIAELMADLDTARQHISETKAAMLRKRKRSQSLPLYKKSIKPKAVTKRPINS